MILLVAVQRVTTGWKQSELVCKVLSRKSAPKCTLNGQTGWDFPGLGKSNRIYHELDEAGPNTDAITKSYISRSKS